MTTPDTLASLIAKWRKSADEIYGTGSKNNMLADHARELQAALDALVEEVAALDSGLAEAMQIVHCGQFHQWTSVDQCKDKLCVKWKKLRVCAAELRGRGARE